MLRKVKINNLINWSHHRFGWHHIINELTNNIHNPHGIDFYTNGTFKKFISDYNYVHTSYWLAFFHITPSDPFICKHLLENRNFQESIKTCKGIFTLSQRSSNFLRKYITCPILSVKYPMPPQFGNFILDDYIKNNEKKVYFVGHWLRNYDDFYKLKTVNQKVLLRCPDTPKEIHGSNFLPEDQYDLIFKKNIIFLSLFDSSANTVILECIANSTPILVNRLEAVVEYLGKDYPLYYDNMNQASELVNSIRKIEEAHFYLKNMNKNELTLESFQKQITDSHIYQKLPCFGKLL